MKTLTDSILSASHGQTLYHKTLRNRDGTALRARVNGWLRTWRSRPDYYELPMKHGLKTCFYITPKNVNEWTTEG